MKINIKDAPSRSETIIRNIAYAVRATAIMTEYYLRSFPVVFFYVLIGFALGKVRISRSFLPKLTR